MAKTPETMKQYTGDEFMKNLHERGASSVMQHILRFLRHPTSEQIETHKRKADGMRRRHFVRAKLEGGKRLCLELDMAYTDVDADPVLLRAVEFDDEAQYDLYRGLAARETPGNIQSN